MDIKYHLGCGEKYFEGYINVDYPQSQHTVANIKADIYENLLKLKYESCQEIRSHHVFEHFNYIESMALLVKWTKALTLEGLLRIDVPDLEALCSSLLESYKNGYILKSFKVLRLLFGSHESDWAYHINGWTPQTLSYVLERFGYEAQLPRHYGNPQADFPNCGVDMLFIKKEEKSNIVEIAKEILNFYTDPVEDPLRQYFHKELDKLLCQ